MLHLINTDFLRQIAIFVLILLEPTFQERYSHGARLEKQIFVPHLSAFFDTLRALMMKLKPLF